MYESSDDCHVIIHWQCGFAVLLQMHCIIHEVCQPPSLFAWKVCATCDCVQSAKVATAALIMKHTQYWTQYEAAAVGHFGDTNHRQLRWHTVMQQQQAYSYICRAISAESKDTVVTCRDARFGSSCGKGKP